MTSKIKVDNIANQSDSNIVNKCSTTITVGTGSDTTNVPGAAVVTGNVTGANVIASGNVVKSNAYQASDGGNIASQSGSTITLGASGDTVTLASGASQSGFGRTGTVDWQTGSIKTSTFTAANGEGYFANTSGGAFTMNLPAGTAGNIVSVVDYTNTFQTNSLTVAANGSQKIGGVAAPNTLTTEGQSVTFVYVDDTEGWKNVQDSTSNVTGSPFLLATGGTITTSGNCKIHTFTGPGTFTVSSVSTNCAAENTVSHLVLAGGGGGGGLGGGGGAGGYREVKTPITPYTASGLNGYPSAPNRVTVTAQAYPITVGAGGTGAPYNSPNPASGSNSVFATITSAGGGGGGSGSNFPNGENGGSGGGGNGGYEGNGGSGNTPPVSPSQGNNGGAANNPYNSGGYRSGGGGGAAGSGGVADSSDSGGGGGGTTSEISSSPVTRAGGGGGGNGPPSPVPVPGGPGGGGDGKGSGTVGEAGTTNLGAGGGGSGGGGAAGGSGGSGIVIIRYKFK
jgi:hypothetical protein|tara:strand:- start:464 stop:1987 length:1524 start_codon:yes stop_codon:yes gene_type:complete